MRRPTAVPRGVLEVDWAFFGELCRALAIKVAREYEPEVVLGIAKAGVIPGAVVAAMFRCDFASMIVTRKETDAEPVLIEGPPMSIAGRRVLLVDETCESGSTLKLALQEVKARRPAEVRTAVSFRTGAYKPDFHAFETENEIILPWDREFLQHGEMVANPHLAPRGTVRF